MDRILFCSTKILISNLWFPTHMVIIEEHTRKYGGSTCVPVGKYGVKVDTNMVVTDEFTAEELKEFRAIKNFFKKIIGDCIE